MFRGGRHYTGAGGQARAVMIVGPLTASAFGRCIRPRHLGGTEGCDRARAARVAGPLTRASVFDRRALRSLTRLLGHSLGGIAAVILALSLL